MTDQKTEQKTLKPSDFTVGQKIIFVGYSNRGRSAEPQEMIINSVGRKWVSASPDGSSCRYRSERFAPPSMVADAGEYSPNGEFVLNLDAWKSERAADAAWQRFRAKTAHASRPKHMTAERIEALIEELKGAA